jgi:hypothetical protein
MRLIDKVIQEQKENEARFAQKEHPIQGVLVGVDSSTSAAVANNPGRVWCRIYGQEESQPIPVLNRKVPPTPELRVIVRQVLSGWEIVDLDSASTVVDTDDYKGQSGVLAHAEEHEPWGSDPLYVYMRAMTMLRCSPTGSGFKVAVPPTNYPTGQGTLATFPGRNNYDLEAHKPASGLQRLVLVFLNTETNALDVVLGSTSPDSPAIIPAKPAIPDDAIPSAYVRLSGDATSLTEADIVEDVRAFISPLVHNAAKIRGLTIETGAPADGEVLAWNETSEQLEWTLGGGGQVKVNEEDTTADYLQNKLSSGTEYLTITEQDFGGNKVLHFTLDPDLDDIRVEGITAPGTEPLQYAMFADSNLDVTANGNLMMAGNILIATGKDIHIAGDEAGLKQRVVDIYQSSITDHFDGSSLDAAWNWASYTGFVTPGNINMTSFPSVLYLNLTGGQSATSRAFAYRSTYGSQISCRCHPALDCRAGLRLDDGSNSNYVELFLEYGSGLMRLRYRYSVAGVVTGPTDIWAVSQPVQWFALKIWEFSTTNKTLYYGVDGADLTNVGLIAPTAITYSRSGIYYEQIAGAVNAARGAAFDWYKQ